MLVHSSPRPRDFAESPHSLYHVMDVLLVSVRVFVSVFVRVFVRVFLYICGRECVYACA